MGKRKVAADLKKGLKEKIKNKMKEVIDNKVKAKIRHEAEALAMKTIQRLTKDKEQELEIGKGASKKIDRDKSKPDVAGMRAKEDKKKAAASTKSPGQQKREAQVSKGTKAQGQAAASDVAKQMSDHDKKSVTKGSASRVLSKPAKKEEKKVSKP